ncbi:uncharacterized protein LOC114354790 isoform X2 [Ostrinia furnacalis]|uniref:uncharacterized protein LOC114354790 isoform X2 n=1 Tax=Ostrinia furnacalis TaxID=93504 RepID=UPI00103B4769|nr:uncharacterized protein LOC114354790 isoform X2 [Ostrinia furnacalis]
MIRIGNHHFSQAKDARCPKTLRTRWVCTKKNGGCRASIITIDRHVIKYEAEFITSRRGNTMIRLGGYHFSLTKGEGPKKRWICTKRYAGCRAFLVTIDGVIAKRKNLKLNL